MLSKIRNTASNKEFIRYIIGGVATTLVNVVIYTVLVLLNMKVRWANLIAIILGKVFGYFANKYYVYQTKSSDLKSMGIEAGKYIVARGLTGVFDYISTVLLVELWQYPPFLTKYFITGIVIILNYLLGKYYVFKK